MKINNIKIIFFILLVVFLITVCYNRNRRLENFSDLSFGDLNISPQIFYDSNGITSEIENWHIFFDKNKYNKLDQNISQNPNRDFFLKLIYFDLIILLNYKRLNWYDSKGITGTLNTRSLSDKLYFNFDYNTVDNSTSNMDRHYLCRTGSPSDSKADAYKRITQMSMHILNLIKDIETNEIRKYLNSLFGKEVDAAVNTSSNLIYLTKTFDLSKFGTVKEESFFEGKKLQLNSKTITKSLLPPEDFLDRPTRGNVSPGKNIFFLTFYRRHGGKGRGTYGAAPVEMFEIEELKSLDRKSILAYIYNDNRGGVEIKTFKDTIDALREEVNKNHGSTFDLRENMYNRRTENNPYGTLWNNIKSAFDGVRTLYSTKVQEAEEASEENDGEVRKVLDEKIVEANYRIEHWGKYNNSKFVSGASQQITTVLKISNPEWKSKSMEDIINIDLNKYNNDYVKKYTGGYDGVEWDADENIKTKVISTDIKEEIIRISKTSGLEILSVEGNGNALLKWHGGNDGFRLLGVDNFMGEVGIFNKIKDKIDDFGIENLKKHIEDEINKNWNNREGELTYDSEMTKDNFKTKLDKIPQPDTALALFYLTVIYARYKIFALTIITETDIMDLKYFLEVFDSKTIDSNATETLNTLAIKEPITTSQDPNNSNKHLISEELRKEVNRLAETTVTYNTTLSSYENLNTILADTPVLITFNYEKVLEKVRTEINSLDPLKSNKTNLDALYIVIYVLHKYYETYMKDKVIFDKYTEQIAPYVDIYVDPIFDEFFEEEELIQDNELRKLVKQYRVLTLVEKSYSDSDYFKLGTDGGGIVVKDGSDCEAHGLRSLTLEECGTLHPKWKNWSIDKEERPQGSSIDILRTDNDGYGTLIDEVGKKWSVGGGNYKLDKPRSELYKENYFKNANLQDYAIRTTKNNNKFDRKESDKYFPKGCSYYKYNNINMFGKYNKLVYNSAGTATNSDDYKLLCKDFKKLTEFLGLPEGDTFVNIKNKIDSLFDGDSGIYNDSEDNFNVRNIEAKLNEVKNNIISTGPKTELGKQIKDFFKENGEDEPRLDLFVTQIETQLAQMIENKGNKVFSQSFGMMTF